MIANLLLDYHRHQGAYVLGQATELCIQAGDGLSRQGRRFHTYQLFETLGVLVDEGKISERVTRSDDEGIPMTPRYHYSMRQ